MNTPTSLQRTHLFIQGADGNLWCRWSDGNRAWNWLNMYRPSDVGLASVLAAVTVMNTPPRCSGRTSFCSVATGTSGAAGWTATAPGTGEQYRPSGVNLIGLAAAVTVMTTPTSLQRPHVFLLGTDGNLWCRWADDNGAWNWLNMYRPPDVSLAQLLGAVTVMNTPTSLQRAHVFLRGTDGNLWCRWADDNGAWNWLNMSPDGVNLTGSAAAVTVMNTPTSLQRTHLFIQGSDGNLWCRRSDDAGAWSWVNAVKPPGANLAGSLRALSVRNTPTAAQRAHLFLVASDHNLWDATAG